MLGKSRLFSAEINWYANQWSDAFDAVKMEKGEEPMQFLSRVDEIACTFASLGVPDWRAT